MVNDASQPRGIPFDPAVLKAFRAEVVRYYREHGRAGMPWRETRDPYRIWVSEVMLQQTQVSRVLPKYEAWMERFPDVRTLADAPLEAVLESWQGLGYNRRAIALKRAAQRVVAEHAGTMPDDEALLLGLPGIGPATAAGILAFAYGRPVRYLETNVRAALLHAFFSERDDVPDTELRPVLDALLPAISSPVSSDDADGADGPVDVRTWYYALMDYGAHVKRTHANPSRRSRHHTRQTPFEGSHRQRRARALRLVMQQPGITVARLGEELSLEPEDASALARELATEGFVEIRDGRLTIAE